MRHIFQKKNHTSDHFAVVWVDELCIYCGRDIQDAAENEACLKRADFYPRKN